MIPDTVLQDIARDFEQKGELLFQGSRNSIKIFDYQGLRINVKAFKKPSFFKKIMYRFVRESKAKRSYANAQFLLENGILTPKPYGFVEDFDAIGLTSSYYFCQQLDHCFALEDVVIDLHYPDRVEILKQYTQVFFKMHEKGIEFVDNSLGNTLITFADGTYQFWLIDLNRLNRHRTMSIGLRMKNFSRLSLDHTLWKVIATEYAALEPKYTQTELFNLIESETFSFYRGIARKRNFKKFRWLELNNLDALK